MAGRRLRRQLGSRLPARWRTRRPTSWPRSPPRPAGPAASTTPTSATRSATATSTRSARRSRSDGGPARRPTSPTSTTARRIPGPAEPMLALVDDARAEGLDVTFDTYPSEWASTRLLIQLPLWVQAGGPGPLKERLADRSARDRLRAEMAARGAAYTGAGRLGRPPPRGVHAPGEPALGVADARRRDGRDRPRRGRRRSATCCCPRTSASAQVTSGPWSKTLPLFVAHPVGMVGTDSTFLGREAGAADLRLLPADPRPVRPRRGPALARGGDPQDDRRRGRPARAA